jgi:hypothetical protein
MADAPNIPPWQSQHPWGGVASSYGQLGWNVKVTQAPNPLMTGTMQLKSHGELFPADDPLALFMMSVSMAGSDLALAVKAAHEHTQANSPSFIYFHRVAIGHWYEAMDALEHFCEAYPEQVGKFLKSRLPADARAELKTARRSRQTIIEAAEHSRQHTFHYPHPKGKGSEGLLRRYLEAIAATPVELNHLDPVVRLSYAQMASFAMSFGRHSVDVEKLNEQMEVGIIGAGAYIRFGYGALNCYLRLKSDGKL